ncbi:MAG: DUF7010 family protein [Pyrinomonadaceae bacterium]
MTDQQFRRGLSGGVIVFAIAGFFWFGVSFGVITTRFGWLVWGLSTAFQFAMFAAILWAALRLRRSSGFTRADLKQADKGQRAETRHIAKAFGWTTLGQALLIAAAVWWCMRAGLPDRVLPVIGLIVSLHFVPLARVFHVRLYYVTALIGSLISLAAITFTGLNENLRLACFGGGMTAVMWLTAGYILWNVDSITQRAMRRTWPV